MSQNEELVRRVYELWARREWSAIPEIFDPEVELDLSRNVFNPDIYSGHTGIERYIRAVQEVWDDFHIAPTEVVGKADHVLATVTLSGTGKESGVSVSMEVMSVWTIRNSRIVRVVGGTAIAPKPSKPPACRSRRGAGEHGAHVAGANVCEPSRGPGRGGHLDPGRPRRPGGVTGDTVSIPGNIRYARSDGFAERCREMHDTIHVRRDPAAGTSPET
jgi:ketosteroid isomerase-like protein